MVWALCVCVVFFSFFFFFFKSQNLNLISEKKNLSNLVETKYLRKV